MFQLQLAQVNSATTTWLLCRSTTEQTMLTSTLSWQWTLPLSSGVTMVPSSPAKNCISDDIRNTFRNYLCVSTAVVCLHRWSRIQKASKSPKRKSSKWLLPESNITPTLSKGITRIIHENKPQPRPVTTTANRITADQTTAQDGGTTR